MAVLAAFKNKFCISNVKRETNNVKRAGGLGGLHKKMSHKSSYKQKVISNK
jgi:hypothetical protein